jgi:lipopolysaccharide/colanic/teichoic acid biosynthesis glycosyltransferase
MTTSILPIVENYYTIQKNQENSPYCTLQWRAGQLLVTPPGQLKQPYLASVDKEESLVKCLKHSPVKLVRIDPKLGEAKVLFWANACQKASKPIYLRIGSKDNIHYGNTLLWWSKRFLEWMTALVFLLLLSPVILGLALLMRVHSSEAITSREWHIGERGRLIRVIKFRTTTVNQFADGYVQKTTFIGQLMSKYGLDNLPKLLNVLRGEMTLIGSRCYTLQEAVRLSAEKQRQLNELPGMTHLSEVKTSNSFHLDSQTL